MPFFQMSSRFLYDLMDESRCLFLRVVSIAIFIFSYEKMAAQSFSNIKTKTLTVESDTLYIDTFSVVPNSLFLTDFEGKEISKEDYDFFSFLIENNMEKET
jgi:hypothetical protein